MSTTNTSTTTNTTSNTTSLKPVSLRPLCSTINKVGKNNGHACSVFAGSRPDFNDACFYHRTNPQIVISSNPEDVCAICHEGSCNFRMSCCNAWYHSTCLETLQKSGRGDCPTCRQPTNIDRNSNRYLLHDFKTRLAHVPPFDPIEDEIRKKEMKLEEGHKKGLSKIEAAYINQVKAEEQNFKNTLKNIPKQVKETYDYKKSVLEQLHVIESMPIIDPSMVKVCTNLLQVLEVTPAAPDRQHQRRYSDDEYEDDE
jgi:hypothetical protein